MDKKGHSECTVVFSRLNPAMSGPFTDYCSPHYKTGLSVPLHPEHVGCGSPSVQEGNVGTILHITKCEGVILDQAPAFDCDVDDILCLTPDDAEGFSENGESCKRCDTFQNMPIPSSTWTRTPERGNGQQVVEGREGKQVEEGREGLKKEMHLNVTEEEEDEGYFSMFSIKDHKEANNSPPSGYIQRSAASYNPLHRIGEVKGAQDGLHPEISSEQAAVSGQHVSFAVNDLCPAVSGPPLESVESDPLDGDVEETWNIGPPMFESSMCHSLKAKFDTGRERPKVTEDVQRGVVDFIDLTHDTLDGDEVTLDTSYDSTLPLQVQVKSVVVVPSQHTTTSTSSSSTTSSSKTAEPPVPKASHSDNYVCSGKRKRLENFHRDVDWECKKQCYVSSVSRHINEHPGADQDVMTELLNLMNHVAEETPGTSEWQHPSDLTRRNYQRRFRNMTSTMTLQEWQEKNNKTHKRFAYVPKTFQRSPLP
uniref:S100P-binding protein n=1 Tax=Scophthalmus maximus TaxID=52904 RepID=A0A8D3CBH3_SCOMX